MPASGSKKTVIFGAAALVVAGIAALLVVVVVQGPTRAREAPAPGGPIVPPPSQRPVPLPIEPNAAAPPNAGSDTPARPADVPAAPSPSRTGDEGLTLREAARADKLRPAALRPASIGVPVDQLANVIEPKVDSVEGEIPVTAVTAALKEIMPAAQRCWSEHAAHTAKPAPELIQLSFTVTSTNGEGTIKTETRAGAAAAEGEISNCIALATQRSRLTLPRADGYLKATYPLRLGGGT